MRNFLEKLEYIILGQLSLKAYEVYQDIYERFPKHRKSCINLYNIFNTGGFEVFTLGHSQKWINMTLKYILLIFPLKDLGFKDIFRFCHYPIDSIFLDQLKTGIEEISKSEWNADRDELKWTQINDYHDYFEIQEWIRKQYQRITPLK
ncbi:MAG: hypothetical protein ACOC1X_02520 [Promethearchaeota archaeon]